MGSAQAFPEAGQAGNTVYVSFFHQELSPEVADKLEAVRSDDDAFRVLGREVFWLCRVRMSDSKVWTRPEIKALRLPTSTMRNMTSIRKLIAQHVDLNFD